MVNAHYVECAVLRACSAPCAFLPNNGYTSAAMTERKGFISAPPLVAVAGWIVPGAGYLLLGQVARGVTIGVTILFLFIAGVLIGGIRVIDVPGFTSLGEKKIVIKPDPDKLVGPSPREWSLRAHPLQTVFEKPWYVGQVLAGPICLAASYLSVEGAKPENPGAVVSRVPPSHARVWEIGTLYTAVAGMLNLLAIIDSSYRAGRKAT